VPEGLRQHSKLCNGVTGPEIPRRFPAAVPDLVTPSRTIRHWR